MDDQLLQMLRCPATKQALRRENDHLIASDGSVRYPIVDGIPVLIDDRASLFSRRQIASSSGPTPTARLSRRFLRRLVPSSTENVASSRNYARFEDLLRGSGHPAPARVLVVGGGDLGRGMKRLAASRDIGLVETDVYLGPRVTVACDGHQLPFRDESFDGVISQAVLEHVLDPERVVSEMHRVLRPGGIIYAETPFMQQVHEGAFDFTRFTDIGHRRLFRWFDEIERGVAVGPASALVWSVRYFARALPRRSRSAALLLDKLATVAFFWLRYIDRVIANHPGALDGASGLYFLGRRLEAPVPDEAIVDEYRGIVGGAHIGRGLKQEA